MAGIKGQIRSNPFLPKLIPVPSRIPKIPKNSFPVSSHPIADSWILHHLTLSANSEHITVVVLGRDVSTPREDLNVNANQGMQEMLDKVATVSLKTAMHL